VMCRTALADILPFSCGCILCVNKTLQWNVTHNTVLRNSQQTNSTSLSSIAYWQ
jgi:hypothetical protein